MASGGNKTGVFNTGIKEIREGFQEIEKRAAKQNRVKKRQLSDEEKARRKELKDMRDRAAMQRAQLSLDKVRHSQNELAHKRERLEDKKTENVRKKQEQADRRNRKAEQDHIRTVNREMSRGPLGKAGSFLGKTAAFAGGGLIGLVVGAALRGYQNYTAFNEALGPSIGMGGRSSKEAWKAGKGKGSNLGFNVMERAQLIPMMGRSTGSVSPRTMMQAMRSTGLEAGETADIFGAIRGGGTQFSGTSNMLVNGKEKNINAKGQGGREFSKMVAAGMYSGLEKARLPEFFTGVASLMRTQGGMSAGNVGQGDFSKIASVLGRTGLSGFQGSRGAEVMSKLQRGILSPGGGENGMAFMRQAFGFGNPNSGTSFYGAEKQREKGLTKDNFSSVMTELTRQYGSGEDASLKMRETFGTSLEQGEELIKLFNSSEEMNTKMEKAEQIMNESKSLEQRSFEEMKAAGTNLTYIKGKFDQSVSIGAKSAVAIEAIEQAQLKLVNFLFDHIPQIKEFLQGILFVLKELAKIMIKGFNLVPGVNIAVPDILKTESELQRDQANSLLNNVFKIGGKSAASGMGTIADMTAAGGSQAAAAQSILDAAVKESVAADIDSETALTPAGMLEGEAQRRLAADRVKKIQDGIDEGRRRRTARAAGEGAVKSGDAPLGQQSLAPGTAVGNGRQTVIIEEKRQPDRSPHKAGKKVKTP